mmetsp:Transcript_15370/g.53328  ORF Transcript_15370/g.53328 Transcript_15370/m.53328 type:complete len:605 (+) Transcript_15370:572-2386(+)
MCFSDLDLSTLNSVSLASECAALGNHTWVACGSATDEATCGVGDYHDVLQCSWEWGECADEAACDAAGECSDQWENRRYVCHDDGWAYGDTCWASYELKLEFNGTTSTTWATAECGSCSESDGVCVEPYQSRGCPDNAWHAAGCKVFGVNSSEACAAVDDAEWMVASSNRTQCEARERCYETWYGHSSKDADECEACGGVREPMFEWHGGNWQKPYSRQLTWFDRVEYTAANNVRAQTSDRHVDDELAGPLMKSFASSKRTQLYLQYSMWTSVVLDLLCECGAYDEAYCKGINATFGAVSGRNTGFCGLEEPMQAGCASVVVNKTCVTWYEGRRLEDGVAEESVELEFRSVAATSIPGARRTDYDGCAADTTSVDALVVENGGGAVVGQLVGDGVAIVATAGDFDDAYLCLDLRTDITVHDDLFSVSAVASYDADDGFAILPNALSSESTAAKYCVTVEDPGTYFPVLVAADVDVACSADCASDGGVCLGDACACFCGYSGSSCASGCKNDCSDAGSCADGVCSCDDGRSGDDCALVDCPTGDDGTYCSLKGVCKDDATCACDPGYLGDACEELDVSGDDLNVTVTFGYDAPGDDYDASVFDGQ